MNNWIGMYDYSTQRHTEFLQQAARSRLVAEARAENRRRRSSLVGAPERDGRGWGARLRHASLAVAGLLFRAS